MTLQASTARRSKFDVQPKIALARHQPQFVNLLSLAREMSADVQLHQALQVTGTALLGVATDGVPLMMRLASPDVTHVLISGNKASGKTEVVRTILASIVLYQKPREIQFLLMDPKASAFEFLANSPHLLGDIATTPERSLQHLRWLENELERRENENVALPRLVVVVDEIAELLTVAGREFQVHLARLAQRGRSTGISLIVCTNKANAGDLNATLRSNFPVRLVGKNSGANDGADKLAGRGDFILNAGGEHVRFQAAYLPPEDLTAFQARVKQGQAQQGKAESGLGGIVNRLRRVK